MRFRPAILAERNAFYDDYRAVPARPGPALVIMP